jgi:soluble P-type ATPase
MNMIKIEIPEFKVINAEHLVLDFNGTLAIDGHYVHDVIGQLVQISANLNVHVLTADTFGSVHKEFNGLPITINVLEAANQDKQKLDYVKNLGSESVIAIGNGRNDVLMLKESALSIGVIQAEGAFYQVLNCSQVICTSINDALSLLINPKRLLATLRN